MADTNEPTTRLVALEKMNAAPHNPRTITEDAKAGLAASMDRFGNVGVIVWNKRSGNIVGGHQRYAILLEHNGKKHKAQTCVVDLSSTDEKALNITLNNPAIAGEFTEHLGRLLSEIAAETPHSLYDALMLDALTPKPKPVKKQTTASVLGTGYTYQVIVDCDDEPAQAMMLQNLKDQGLTCRTLTT